MNNVKIYVQCVIVHTVLTQSDSPPCPTNCADNGLIFTRSFSDT